MKCCEQVIVTLRFSGGQRAVDMELPAFVPVGELSGKILEALHSLNPAAFASAAALTLGRGGKSLPAQETLASAGIWDGGTLDVILQAP